MQILRLSLICLAVACSACATVQTKRVVLDPSAENQLAFFYGKMTTEFAFCSYGKKKGDTVRIKRLVLPWYGDAGANSVDIDFRESLCPEKDLLGIIHSHPSGGECQPSRVDLYEFLYSDVEYHFVYCGGKGFAWVDVPKAKAAYENLKWSQPLIVNTRR